MVETLKKRIILYKFSGKNQLFSCHHEKRMFLQARKQKLNLLQIQKMLLS